MSLLSDIEGIAAVIEQKYQGAAVYKLEAPTELQQGDFVVQLKQEVRSSESRNHTFAERQYTIAFAGDTNASSLMVMETLSHLFMNAVTQSGDLEAHQQLSVETFTYEASVRTEGGLFVCTAVILIRAREARAFKPAQKMNSITIRTP